MQKNIKKIEQLKKLKLLQQQKLRILITQIEKEKNNKLNEIKTLDDKIQDLYSSKANGYNEFYKSIKKTIYSYEKVLDLNFTTAKIDVNIEELSIKKNILVDELQEIESNLVKEKYNLKNLIIKEEKYKEFTK